MKVSANGPVIGAIVGDCPGFLGVNMSRYQVSKEFTGKAKPQHVVRFLGEFVSAHEFKGDAIQAMRDHATSTRPEIVAYRKPTPSEIKFGYGATHYADFPHGLFLNDDGSYKKRIVFDGLTYSR